MRVPANHQNHTPGVLVVAEGDVAGDHVAASGSGSGSQTVTLTSSITALQPMFYSQCPPGHFCGNGTERPEPCPKGTANPLKGQGSSASCKLCTAGKYASSVGSTYCLTCGSYAGTDGEGAQACRCNFKHRAYHESDATCSCELGYDAVGIAEDCVLKTYAQCSAVATRTSNGNCVDTSSSATRPSSRRRRDAANTDADCDVQCAGSAKANRWNSFGECECSSYTVYSDVCDLTCHYMKPTLSCGSRANTFLVTDATGVRTQFQPSDVAGACSADAICHLVAFEDTANVAKGLIADEAYLSALFSNDIVPQNVLEAADAALAGAKTALETCLRLETLTCEDEKTAVAEAQKAVTSNNNTRHHRGAYVPNPILCVTAGDAVVFQCSAASFPQYADDNLLNSNPSFDYGAFRELKRRMINTQMPVSVFVHEFDVPGLYVFVDYHSANKRLFVNVIAEGQSCPGTNNDALSPSSEAMLVAAGAESQDINLEPDWLVLVVCVGVTFSLAWLIAGAIRFSYKVGGWSFGNPYTGNTAFLAAEPHHDGAASASESATFKESRILHGFNVKNFIALLDGERDLVTLEFQKQTEEFQTFYKMLGEQTESLKDAIREKDTTILQAAQVQRRKELTNAADSNLEEDQKLFEAEQLLDDMWKRLASAGKRGRQRESNPAGSAEHFPIPDIGIFSVDDADSELSDLDDADTAADSLGDTTAMTDLIDAQRTARFDMLKQRLVDRNSAQATVSKLFSDSDAAVSISAALAARMTSSKQTKEGLSTEDTFANIVDTFAGNVDVVNLKLQRARDNRAKALQDRLALLKAQRGAQGDAVNNAAIRSAFADYTRQNIAHMRHKLANDRTLGAKLRNRLAAKLKAAEKDLDDLDTAALASGPLQHMDIAAFNGVVQGLVSDELTSTEQAHLELQEATASHEAVTAEKAANDADMAKEVDACADAFNRVVDQLVADGTADVQTAQDAQAKQADMLALRATAFKQMQETQAAQLAERMEARKRKMSAELRAEQDSELASVANVIEDLMESEGPDSKFDKVARMKSLQLHIAGRHKQQKAALEKSYDSQQALFEDELSKLTNTAMVESIIADQEALVAAFQTGAAALSKERGARLAKLKGEASKRAAARRMANEASLTGTGTSVAAGELNAPSGEPGDGVQVLTQGIVQDGIEAQAGYKHTPEEDEAALKARHAQEMKDLEERLDAEAAAKELDLLRELQKRKDALNVQREAQRAELLGKANAVSAEDAKTLVQNFDIAFDRIERGIESQKLHSSNAAKQKLAARRAARQKRLKAEQRSERHKADLAARQEQAATEIKEIKEQEAAKIDTIKSQETSHAVQRTSSTHTPGEDGGQDAKEASSSGQEQSSTQILISSVLEQRHSKEISDLEGQRELLESLAMDRAELPINTLNDKAVQDLVCRQEQETADLFDKMRDSDEAQTKSAHDALTKAHNAQLNVLSAEYESLRLEVCLAGTHSGMFVHKCVCVCARARVCVCGCVEAGREGRQVHMCLYIHPDACRLRCVCGCMWVQAREAGRQQAEAEMMQNMLDLRDRQYDEVHATLEAFAPTDEASKATALKVTNLCQPTCLLAGWITVRSTRPW